MEKIKSLAKDLKKDRVNQRTTKRKIIIKIKP